MCPSEPSFNIVLVHPKIPPNTGNIGRLCVNLDARLHLVGPLGFDLSEKALRRAGLDYWKELDLKVWDSLEEFLAAHPVGEGFHLATTKTERLYWEAEYRPGDWLLFGSETEGLPGELLAEHRERCITIPMGAKGRSLNLAVAAGIVSYEALRQCFVGK